MNGQENYFFNSEVNQLSQLLSFITASHLENFYKKIFEGEILPWQVWLVTGSGPFDEQHLLGLCTKLGLYCDEEFWNLDDIFFPEDAPLFVIIGRNNFDKEELKNLLETFVSNDVINRIFISQEDFINYWFFNIEPNYYPGDSRINDHPGLRYLAELGKEYPWPWPSTEASLAEGEFDDSELEGEHPLKSRFGYNVNAKIGLTGTQRHKILDQALTAQIEPLELKDVVYHIGWLVRTRKNMRNPKLKPALSKWENDLEYLRKKYYKTQFQWPPTDARSW